MRLIMLSLLLFLCNMGFAQTDTVYYDDNNRPTEFDYANYYRTYTFISNNRYKVDEYTISNKLQMTGFFTAKKDGIRNGLFVYYEKGKRTEEEFYDMGVLAGEWKKYYPETQQLWCSKVLKTATEIELTSYYPDGKLKNKETHRGGVIVGKTYDTSGKEVDFVPFEKIAEPSSYNISDYLSKNLRYPENARENNIQGKVIVKFTVLEDGRIANATVTQHVSEDCDKEALRVVTQMPKWRPGMIEGRPVKVSFSLPVVFLMK